MHIDRATVFAPDTLVYRGARADPDAIEIRDPVIVVEVPSPGTAAVDASRRLAGYFSLASVPHSVLIDPVKRPVVHPGAAPRG